MGDTDIFPLQVCFVIYGMKKVFLSLILIFLCLNVFSQKGDFGMGVILGNPTSLSVKYWTGDLTAIDASLGYRYGSANHLYLNTDFLFHLVGLSER